MSELAYHTLVRELLQAPIKQNRTGVPTRSLFMRTLRFPLMRDGDPILPLLTTKKMALRAITTELLWFLNGDTNTSYLNKHGCKIWNDNATREFLDGRNLDYPEGELGPVYGHQWRGFNAPFTSSEGNNDTDKIPADQIAQAIHLLKTDPMSRRIVVSAWNPAQIQYMALPPCHYAFQFVCEPIKSGYTVNTCMHMRSADVGLGVPFNIASYALLTHIICAQCGPMYVPGELVITMADCHIYTNHADGLSEQIMRWPRQYPKVSITNGTLRELYDIGPSCVKVEGYDPHPAISMQMAV
jgi:thymidylate synthase